MLPIWVADETIGNMPYEQMRKENSWGGGATEEDCGAFWALIN